MPCPHFSPDDKDCRILEVVADEEDSRGPALCDEPLNLSVCLAQDSRYRACAIYRRRVAELSPWPAGMQFGGK